jgi:hypothetical protein
MTPSGRTYYHFTPLAPGEWSARSALDTARVEANLYWLKTFSQAAYDADRLRALALAPGASHVGAARFADALAGRDYLLACMRELLFDSVREQLDPALPSRRRCLFVIDGRADLAAAARRYGFDRQRRAILEIEPLAGCRTFRARSAWLETSPIVRDIMDAAGRYWSGAEPDAPHEDVEILLEGAFAVRAVACDGDAAAPPVRGQSFVDVFQASA